MNKVITINLNGNAFPLEEDGYEALRAYLDTAARQLGGNPDKDEIIADIEQAISDKFRAVLGAYKTVVVTKEVESIISEMGPVQDPSASSASQPSASSGARASSGPAGQGGSETAGAQSGSSPFPKRLHKVRDGAMIGGVCNGLADYLGIDVTIVRIAFVFLFLAYGTGALMYLLMMIIFPSAEKASSGGPSTAQEFIHRAKQGYYEGMKTFGDKAARREWKGKFKQDMRGWKRDFQKEMHENAHRWGRNWHSYCSQPAQHGFGAFIVFPFLAVINALIALLGIFALISFISTGAVFGLALPFSAPLWVGILFLLVVYKIVVWPLKSVRHAYYFNGIHGPRYAGFFLGLAESVAWMGFLVFLLWFASRHLPQAHEALRNLPHEVHHAVDSVRQWWNGQ